MAYDSQGLQLHSSGQQTDKSKGKKYLSAWINWNVSENTFGIIFRNVRCGDDRIGTVFPTVSVHQSFRVQVSMRREKPLLSAILEKMTTRNKRKYVTCHPGLWQKCYKMTGCPINKTHNLEKRPLIRKGWRDLFVFLLMKTILLAPRGMCPALLFFTNPTCLVPMGYFYKCVSNE